MRLFHGLLAYRGGKDIKSKAFTALQGVEICASDFPVGQVGVVVKGEVNAIYARDCWSELQAHTEHKIIPAHYVVSNLGAYDVCGAFTEVRYKPAFGYFMRHGTYDVCGAFTRVDITWVEDELDYYTHTHDKRVSDMNPITLGEWYTSNKESYAEFFIRVNSVTDVWIKSGCTEYVKQQAIALASFLGLSVIEVLEADNVTDLFYYDYLHLGEQE